MNTFIALFSAVIAIYSSTTALQVFSIGVIGAIFSMQRRITMTDIGSGNWLQGYVFLSVIISPLVGGIGALLVYAFISGDMFSGAQISFLPQFEKCPPNVCANDHALKIVF